MSYHPSAECVKFDVGELLAQHKEQASLIVYTVVAITFYVRKTKVRCISLRLIQLKAVHLLFLTASDSFYIQWGISRGQFFHFDMAAQNRRHEFFLTLISEVEKISAKKALIHFLPTVLPNKNGIAHPPFTLLEQKITTLNKVTKLLGGHSQDQYFKHS